VNDRSSGRTTAPDVRHGVQWPQPNFRMGVVVWTKRAAFIGIVYAVMFGQCLAYSDAVTGSLKHPTLPTSVSRFLLAGAVTSGIGFVISIGIFLNCLVAPAVGQEPSCAKDCHAFGRTRPNQDHLLLT